MTTAPQRKPREPEMTGQPDTGCYVYSSCLTCPLPQCIYDETKEERAGARQRRDAAVGQRFLAILRDDPALVFLTQARRLPEGIIDQLVWEFSLSRRTIQRILTPSRMQELLSEPPLKNTGGLKTSRRETRV